MVPQWQRQTLQFTSRSKVSYEGRNLQDISLVTFLPLELIVIDISHIHDVLNLFAENQINIQAMNYDLPQIYFKLDQLEQAFSLLNGQFSVQKVFAVQVQTENKPGQLFKQLAYIQNLKLQVTHIFFSLDQYIIYIGPSLFKLVESLQLREY